MGEAAAVDLRTAAFAVVGRVALDLPARLGGVGELVVADAELHPTAHIASGFALGCDRLHGGVFHNPADQKREQDATGGAAMPYC